MIRRRRSGHGEGKEVARVAENAISICIIIIRVSKLAPTSRFPSRGKGYASRAWPEGSAGHQQKIAVINHLAKKVASVADVNLWPEHKARLEGETQQQKKTNRRDATDHQRIFNALVYAKGVKNAISLYLIKT